MSRPTSALLIALAFAAAACAGPGGEPRRDDSSALVGRIYDVAAGRFIDEAALLGRLERARFVLLGERHDNPEHHRLQARLVRELQRRWPAPAPVAFEMMTTDQQHIVTEHVQAAADGAAGLGAALDWDESGWPAWAFYEPIAEAATDAGAEIVAANLPRQDVRSVFAAGTAALDPALLRRTGLGEPLPPPLAADLRTELEEAHCGHTSADAVEGMFRVQRARDARMADRLARLSGTGHGILIAGAGHARNDRGVPWYLEHLRPDAEIASVAFVEADDADVPPGGLPFDYLWFTEAPEREDPCAGLEERLKTPG